ncbi:hypothetical protein TNIN_161901 [Trichonephila inaurata madagascariensis]|uniref:Uncharacterized protein n=1 Tax=Trichonephila inaurata madagascariensis TaxID=2747483 RepID=A0A8X7C2R2_9ARAC|nr:hypothetical protein TNIN_161901 [Trichonephila inaurata madagascariensis]
MCIWSVELFKGKAKEWKSVENALTNLETSTNEGSLQLRFPFSLIVTAPPTVILRSFFTVVRPLSTLEVHFTGLNEFEISRIALMEGCF